MATVITTTTSYLDPPNNLRFRLACEMVTSARDAGYPVVIVDNSPDPTVTDTLRRLGAIVFPQVHKGMGASRREVFFHGWTIATESDIGTITWMEAEKVGFIGCIEQLLKTIESGADIVIPSRSEASLETWPAFQQQSEREANRIYNEALGTVDFDPMFGPVVFRVQMARYFVLSNPGELGIEDTYIQHYGPPLARLDGAQVRSTEVTMTYPPEQKAEEEGALNAEMLEKRKRQKEKLSEAYRTLGALG